MFRFMRYSGLYWCWISLLSMLLDVISKKLVLANIMLYESKPLMPFINLFFSRNYGAAFSLFSNSNGWQHWVMIIATFVIISIILRIMYDSKSYPNFNNISYALLLGGAVGNLFDRIFHGFVIDFIDLHIENWHFPTFNIADSCISIATFLLGIKYLFNHTTDK
ncbi:signal peptidase II [Candidatus Ishikawella capsulata]|uniref:Lipoprotein signal peptidase n=1 Tax=Candidatus Ishikawaella capsulata Mpkobe TaxID=476281 RepID=C5WCW4_9ENTR|nr:signal peptidase II [Candidatus Ishikawaella capsulata]BAH83170.1 signal peptidase II [Candidatus Ishikawaella capsulata Mpkobe]